jgi:hypothetical protein
MPLIDGFFILLRKMESLNIIFVQHPLEPLLWFILEKPRADQVLNLVCKRCQDKQAKKKLPVFTFDFKVCSLEKKILSKPTDKILLKWTRNDYYLTIEYIFFYPVFNLTGLLGSLKSVC